MIKNNNLRMEYAIDMIDLPMIGVMIYMPHALYNKLQFMWVQIDTI